MTRFPAAYCATCKKWLSPQGNMKMARTARESHRRQTRKFLGYTHTVGIYHSKAELEGDR